MHTYKVQLKKKKTGHGQLYLLGKKQKGQDRDVFIDEIRAEAKQING